MGPGAGGRCRSAAGGLKAFLAGLRTRAALGGAPSAMRGGQSLCHPAGGAPGPGLPLSSQLHAASILAFLGNQRYLFLRLGCVGLSSLTASCFRLAKWILVAEISLESRRVHLASQETGAAQEFPRTGSRDRTWAPYITAALGPEGRHS